eukprot:TRINITY_DN2166_c0_g1_i1.p1 TRINITY_DN2166_c0_g1~~TRINITY_DN2166_c0_g1_i1.p1  ORF type:complete len:503 (-),score=66.92 TRINITY_DN2166_c0_g1_i1:73-1581(-)
MSRLVVLVLFLLAVTTALNLEQFEKVVLQKWSQFSSTEKAQIKEQAFSVLGQVGNKSTDDLVHQWAKETPCVRTNKCWDIYCAEVCEIGTVQVDPWLKYALQTQKEIQMGIPLNYTVLPGTHNSAISKAYGYGVEETSWTYWLQFFYPEDEVIIANQPFSITDQLNFGVRHIELDSHWYDDAIRICHAGGVHLEELDAAIKFIAKLLDLQIDWDSETLGCFGKRNRLLNTTFAEIKEWITLPENSEEVLIFMFDDQYDLNQWGKVPLLMEGLQYYFGDLLFTPPEKAAKYPKEWPSMTQLVQSNKRIIFTSRSDYGSQMSSLIFARDSVWTEFGPLDNFKPYPVCTLTNSWQLNNGNLTRVVCDSLMYGPFLDGSDQVLLPSDMSPFYDCAANFLCIDQASPKLQTGAVWSWDVGEPVLICTVLKPNGRWGTVACNETLSYACQSTSDPNQWVVDSRHKGPRGGLPNCPTGYTFSLPRNGFQNQKLWKTAANSLPIWIDYSV